MFAALPPLCKGRGTACGGGIVGWARPIGKRRFFSFTIPQSAPLTAPFTQGSQTERRPKRGAFFQLSRRRQKNRRIPGPPVFVSFRGGDRRSFPFLLSSFFSFRFSADFKDGKFSPAGSAAGRRRKSLCSVFSGQIFPLHYI